MNRNLICCVLSFVSHCSLVIIKVRNEQSSRMFLKGKIFLDIFDLVPKFLDFKVLNSTFLVFNPLFVGFSLLYQIINHFFITFMFRHEMLHFLLAFEDNSFQEKRN